MQTTNSNSCQLDDYSTRAAVIIGATSIGVTNVNSNTNLADTGLGETSVTASSAIKTVNLYGAEIVSLTINGQERLCLAQISNTLLSKYSYNEIHNRRVALGITCVQCTPVQLDQLRRAGAMPISSRRCGMITKREAERLVKSFLDEITPPKLPMNFMFNVSHSCGWGCNGQFIPGRYNSSRAKCIKCCQCGTFYSPNKFIFHCHKPDADELTRSSNTSLTYHHPDAANFNAWRRHLILSDEFPPEQVVHAWEDVKAMFNGGNRKRLLNQQQQQHHHHHQHQQQQQQNAYLIDSAPSSVQETTLFDHHTVLNSPKSTSEDLNNLCCFDFNLPNFNNFRCKNNLPPITTSNNNSNIINSNTNNSNSNSNSSSSNNNNNNKVIDKNTNNLFHNLYNNHILYEHSYPTKPLPVQLPCPLPHPLSQQHILSPMLPFYNNNVNNCNNNSNNNLVGFGLQFSSHSSHNRPQWPSHHLPDILDNIHGLFSQQAKKVFPASIKMDKERYELKSLKYDIASLINE